LLACSLVLDYNRIDHHQQQKYRE